MVCEIIEGEGEKEKSMRSVFHLKVKAGEIETDLYFENQTIADDFIALTTEIMNKKSRKDFKIERLMHPLRTVEGAVTAIGSSLGITKEDFNEVVRSKYVDRTDEYDEGVERDELFEDAARIIVETQTGSPVSLRSILQRRLKLGYHRAGRLLQELETTKICSCDIHDNGEAMIKTMAELEKYLKKIA